MEYIDKEIRKALEALSRVSFNCNNARPGSALSPVRPTKNAAVPHAPRHFSLSRHGTIPQ
jgi:hypothetical protein